ncbi:MAG: aspartate-semialdehyde dehydrogenase [Chloroflexi bacterium]|nr:aspartate-semialdehyde dehydrogenase [Chloroflexota bacterium]
MRRPINIAVLGATGLVGLEFLRILEERSFPVGEVRALASARSEGKKIPFKGGELTVHAVSRDAFKGMDFALIAVGDDVSQEWAPIAAEAGCIVVDKSNAFRMDPSVPLVVPEVNPEDTRGHQGIIAGPNCSTIQMVMALAPLHRVNPITRVIADTYQSASGAGLDAVEELWEETRAVANGKDMQPSFLPYPLAMNLFPQIGGFSANGYCSEEIKLINETRKILHEPGMAISATTVRVPVEISHSEALHVEFTHAMSASEARSILADSPGIAIIDEPFENQYPMPLFAAGKDEVFVGRIRNDLSHPHGIAMWVVSDNLRKGAALNAVQVAELMMEQDLL